MRDTCHKFEILRVAKAEDRLRMAESTVEAIGKGKVPKGDVLTMLKAAAVMASKKTAELIPRCHPLPVDFVNVNYEMRKDEIVIRSEVKAIWKTGVEMEALTAVSAAALTGYDMLNQAAG